ncbi:DUF2947 family protein [Marinomonas atlantica]|uniref:DUF2947 family protein n=1 Tax=Marinomonas atlantica TaxID=1806668 RepID=UPI000831FF25|nr:DUF2947 family protein [Marinomonas atlantica]MCO4785532.1 DUF2947 family protein [Marinomonas atlantica]
MSQYRPLSGSGKEWVFRRGEPFVSEQDRAQILLLSHVAGANIWRDYISDAYLFPDLFADEVWVKANRLGSVDWETLWESDELGFPVEALEHCDNWGSDTKIYFCCHADFVIETTWGVFLRTWKAFLFLDSDAILVGRKKKQALQFCEKGDVALLVR